MRPINDHTVVEATGEMKALAEAAALEVVKWGMLNWHSYLLVAAKKSR